MRSRALFPLIARLYRWTRSVGIGNFPDFEVKRGGWLDPPIEMLGRILNSFFNRLWPLSFQPPFECHPNSTNHARVNEEQYGQSLIRSRIRIEWHLSIFLFLWNPISDRKSFQAARKRPRNVNGALEQRKIPARVIGPGTTENEDQRGPWCMANPS